MRMVKFIPNILTSARVAGAAVLFFVKPFSPLFFLVYTVCGVSDVLDGTVARITKNTSDVGAMLDSVADLIFYSAMLLKIMPILIEKLNLVIWTCAALVIAVRIGAYLVGVFKYRKFSSMHTYLNKASGAAVFLLPYMIRFPCFIYYCVLVCVIAFTASLEELVIHIKNKSYNPDVKSIFVS